MTSGGMTYSPAGKITGACLPAAGGSVNLGDAYTYLLKLGSSLLTTSATLTSQSEFSSWYGCTGTVVSNPRAGTPLGSDSAQALADGLCASINDCGACAQQFGCGWLNGTCLAFWPPTGATGSYLFARAPFTCPLPCSALITGVSSIGQCPGFCETLSNKGCRTCASTQGCAYCHSTSTCISASARMSCPALGPDNNPVSTYYYSGDPAGYCDNFCTNTPARYDCYAMAGTQTCGFCQAPPANVAAYRVSLLTSYVSYSGYANPTYLYGSGGAGQVANASSGYASTTFSYTSLECSAPIPGASSRGSQYVKGVWVPPASDPSKCSAPCAGLGPGACLSTSMCGLCTAADGSRTCLLAAAAVGPFTSVSNGRPIACPTASTWFGPNSLVGYSLASNYSDACAMRINSRDPKCSSCAQSSVLGGCGFCKSSQTCVPANVGNTGPLYAGDCPSNSGSFGVSNWVPSTGLTGYPTDQCPMEASCTGFMSCSSCLAAGPTCGWCPASSSNNWLGACQPARGGSTTSPAAGFSCSASGFTAGVAGAVCPALTCSSFSSYSPTSDSLACSRCLDPGSIGALAVDGPCGYCATTGACYAGSYSGPNLPYGPSSLWSPILPVCPAPAWRFGGSVVSTCNAGIPPITCPALGCAACSSSSACAWCVSTASCVPTSALPNGCPTGDTLRYLQADASYPTLAYSVGKCPDLCASLTSDPIKCVSVPSCLWCNAPGMQRCIPGNATGPADPALCPAGTTPPANPSSAPVPNIVYGSASPADGAVGFLPNLCSQMPNCTTCLNYRLPGNYGARPGGCGWCRSGPNGAGRCVPGNATFGPYSAGTCPAADWFPETCSRRCYSAGGSCAAATQRWGCGWCPVPTNGYSYGATLPGTSEGPSNGYCSAGWTTSSATCPMLGTTGSISLAFLPTVSLSFPSMPTISAFDAAVSACDAACLSKGLSLSYRPAATGSSGDVTATMLSFVRGGGPGLPGCTCLPAVVTLPLSGLGSSTYFWVSGGLGGAQANFSTQPSPSNVRFTWAFSTSSVSGLLAPVYLSTYNYLAYTSRTAYYGIQGCGTVAGSRLCVGSSKVAYVSDALIPAVADACFIACARSPSTLVFTPSYYYSTSQGSRMTVVPALSSPPDAPPGCKCTSYSATLGGCTSTYNTPYFNVPGTPFNASLSFGTSKDGNVNTRVMRASGSLTQQSGPNLVADAGYATYSLSSCVGVQPGLCTLAGGSFDTCQSALTCTSSIVASATPIPSVLPTAPTGFGAAIRTQALSPSVDDCTFSCLLGGYTILVSGAAVSLQPQVATPYTDCVCPSLNGTAWGAGSTVTGALVSAGATYAFTARVDAANQITLSLSSADGAVALGSATYDTPGCTNTSVYFCGRAPDPTPGTAGSSPSSVSVIAGVVVGVLVLAVVGGLVYVFVIKPRLAAHRKPTTATGGSSKPSTRFSKTAPAAVADENPAAVTNNPMAAQRLGAQAAYAPTKTV